MGPSAVGKNSRPPSQLFTQPRSVRSKVVTPHAAFSGLCHRVCGRGCEPLTQDGQSRAELVCSDVRPAHAALSREARAAVKHTVVVDRKDNSWGKLNPILRVLGGDEFVPSTHCLVQTRDVFVRHVPKGTSIVVVSSHRPQVSGCVVLQRCVRSTVQDPRFACGVGGYRDR